MDKTCECCKKNFTPHPAVPNQRYCSFAACQRARKSQWHKQKLADDPDYRENQAAAHREWRAKNRGYWKGYRAKNPASTELNRVCQRVRNQKRLSKAQVIAKMDELPAQTRVNSGRYRLVALSADGIANMDELIVEIGVITGSFPTSPPGLGDCKERTS